MKAQNSRWIYRCFFNLLLGVLFVIVLSRPAFAQAEDKSPVKISQNERIKITADNLTVDNEAKYAEFSGNVKAQQGTNSIRSDTLRIYYKGGLGDKDQQVAGEDVIERIVATGNVKIRFDDKVAVTDEAVYISGEQMLVLSGPNTRVLSGNDSIAGEKITLYRESGKIQIAGSKKTRVEAVFYPGEKGGIQ